VWRTYDTLTFFHVIALALILHSPRRLVMLFTIPLIARLGSAIDSVQYAQ